MNFREFTRKYRLIIFEIRRFFRPKNGGFMPWKVLAFSIIILATFLFISVLVYNFVSASSIKVLAAQDDRKIAGEINHWQEIVSQYPNYRDGYIQLAILYYDLKNNNQAWLYLDKAKNLDPNNDTVKKLTTLLENDR